MVANYSELMARSAMDRERFTPAMMDRLNTDVGLSPEWRWGPRCRRACVFCARFLRLEELREIFLAGAHCFMASPAAVAQMLSWEEYHRHWPDIPASELRASSVHLRIGETDEERGAPPQEARERRPGVW